MIQLDLREYSSRQGFWGYENLMTYQELIQANDESRRASVGSLPVEQQDSLIELIRQQQDEQKQTETLVEEEDKILVRNVDKSSRGATSSSRLKHHFSELTSAQLAQRAERNKNLKNGMNKLELV